MAYEKPRLIDLSEEKVKGSGIGCMDGSGDAFECVSGATADFCSIGMTFQVGPGPGPGT